MTISWSSTSTTRTVMGFTVVPPLTSVTALSGNHSGRR